MMKGLLYKDFWMLWKYCKTYLLLAVVFGAMSAVNDTFSFYAIYPCIFCGTLPVSILSYDERDKWLGFCAALPVSRKTYVTAKYVLSLLTQGIVLGLMALALGLRLVLNDGFTVAEFAMTMGMMGLVGLAMPALMLPFLFNMGVEKGRMVYLVVIGLMAATTAGFSVAVDVTALPAEPVFVLVALAAVGLFIGSWWLSVRFYEKREL